MRRGSVALAIPARVALVALLAVVSLLAAACTSGDDGPADGSGDDGVVADKPVRGGTLRLGVAGVTTLDPALVVPTETGEMIAADLLFDGLTVQPEGVDAGAAAEAPRIGSEVAVEPDVAESITPDQDHLVWMVTLQDRTFTDGTPITAGDVKFSLERVAALASSSLPGSRLELIEGYDALAAGQANELSGLRVIDARTLEIRLREPYVELPLLLSSPAYGIVPRASANTAGFDQAPVGSGPYRFVAREGDVASLERADGPAGEGVLPDSVELVSFATSAKSFEAFVDGRVDWSLVPATQDALRDATNAQTGDAFEFLGATLWLGLNTRNPALVDERFREAIAHAVSSDAVVGEALPGRWPVRSVVPRGVPGYDDAVCEGVCELDVARARALLAEVFPDGAVPTVVLDGYEDPVERAMLESVRTDLAEVGIPAEVRLRPLEEYRLAVATGQVMAFSYGWVGLVPSQDSYLAPFLAGSPDNVTGVQHDLINGTITRARAEADPAVAVPLYQEAERTVLDLAVVVPIAQLRVNQVVSARVRGFETRLDGTFATGSVWLSG